MDIVLSFRDTGVAEAVPASLPVRPRSAVPVLEEDEATVPVRCAWAVEGPVAAPHGQIWPFSLFFPIGVIISCLNCSVSLILLWWISGR